MEAWKVTVILSGMVFFSNSGHGQGVFQFHVGFVGNVGVHGVADPGYSNWWAYELGCRLRLCLVRRSLFGWISNRSIVSWVSISETTCSQLHIVEEMCR